MLTLYFSINRHPDIPIHIRSETWLNYLKTIIKLAQNLIFNTHVPISLISLKIIYSQAFLEKSRKSEKDFSRSRKLPFALLVLYLCNLTKSSYQPELNKFFKILTGSTVAKNIVSKVALCNGCSRSEQALKKTQLAVFISFFSVFSISF